MKKYSYSYKFKSKFYNTLDIDFKTRQLIRTYNVAKDLVMKDKTIFFVKEKNNEND